MPTPAGIFLVTRPNGHQDYDEFDSFVVAARDAFVARRTHPRSTRKNNACAPYWSEQYETWVLDNEPVVYHSWTGDIESLTVTRIGDYSADDLGVICASFNAG